MFIITHPYKYRIMKNLGGNGDSITVWFRLDLRNRLQQVLNDLGALLIFGGSDFSQLLLYFLVGFFLGFRVYSSMLYTVIIMRISFKLQPGNRTEARTSDSNFLNSVSFCFLYSSISFWASLRASFTFWVRSERKE